MSFRETSQKLGETTKGDSKQEKRGADWDKISWSKCKHAYLVELFKKEYDADIDKAEKIAEKWADASMRKLGTEDEITTEDIPF